MDEKLKKTVTCTVISAFALGGVGAGVDCGRFQMCAVENPEVWHTHEREPAPMQTIVVQPAITTTLSTASMFGVIMPPWRS